MESDSWEGPVGVFEETLGLTDASARVQWRRIALRRPASRQEAYLPVELVICMSLFRILRPNSYGGANIHTVPIEVKVLAQTFQRTPGSIVSKMLNLKGARENGAAREPELFQALSVPGQLEPYLRLVVAAARTEGFQSDRVPEIVQGRSA